MQIKQLFFFGVFALLGVVSLWLSLTSLIPAARALENHATIVEFSPLDVIGLPLAVVFFALGTMTLLPTSSAIKRPNSKQRKVSARNSTALNLCLTVAVAGVFSTIAAVPIAAIGTSIMLPSRGYTQCPPIPTKRRAPGRWALDTARCP